MKPQFLLDEGENRRNAAQYDRCPAVCFEGVRKYLDFAREHGMKMRGIPSYGITRRPDGFSQKGTAGKRMLPLRTGKPCLPGWRGISARCWNLPRRSTRGIIYAWDVVNEAVEDGGAAPFPCGRKLWVRTLSCRPSGLRESMRSRMSACFIMIMIPLFPGNGM